MEKIQFNHDASDMFEVLGLPATDEQKTDLAKRTEAVCEKFIDAIDAEDKTAYIRSHFAEDVYNTLSPEEILLFAINFLEQIAVQRAQRRHAAKGLEGLMKALEDQMRADGVDVDALKAEAEAQFEAATKE